MILSTRDAQRARRATLFVSAAARTELANMAGVDNVSFQMGSLASRRSLGERAQTLPASANPAAGSPDGSAFNDPDDTDSKKWRYHWRMTHYFYIHMALFVLNSLLGGLIIVLIENHSSSRNRVMSVTFIDAWFVSSSCVCTCGLTTLDFANLSTASQLILMFFTFISGITISTLPALVIKARTHKRVEGVTVDDDHDDWHVEEGDELPTFNVRGKSILPLEIRKKLATLPTTAQLRYRAYITCIIFILATCFVLYTIAFIAIGAWLQTKYTPDQLMQGNATVNPWYASFIITLTGFNQNGLTPFSSGFGLFVSDVYLNLFAMLIVITGTSLFPFILRNVILLAQLIAPWRHKVVLDYILINNHRLSTLLFPAVQTRVYLLVTAVLYLIGVGISLIIDLHRSTFASYGSGERFLIFLFQTVNLRFAGFQSVDLNSFAAATLLVYLVLMATKPQMLCSLDESPFEVSWLALQVREEVVAQTAVAEMARRKSISPPRSRSGSTASAQITGALPLREMKRFLRRQSLITKDLARKEFAHLHETDGTAGQSKSLGALRTRLFLIYFIRALFENTFSYFVLTRTWLFVFIFLICAIEHDRMAPIDPDITIFKVVFEIVSAFGTVGSSLGYPNVASSFGTVLSPASKVIIIFTMLMGRHRGLLASMKDQEVIEHSAADSLQRCRDQLIEDYEKSKSMDEQRHQDPTEVRIDRF